MTTLKASRLKGTLERARNVGLCEESCVVAGMPVTVRNLRPEEYTEIYNDLEGVEEGVAYMHAHQVEHVSRAICLLDGDDYRGVDFIEVEQNGSAVNIPRSEWLRDNVVSTWGREVLHVVHRKFLDACIEADNKAKDGVVFRVADETPEEKFRRLLAEALAAGEDVPEDIRVAILREADLLVATSEEELHAANEKAKEFLAEQRRKMEQTQEEASPEESPEEPPYEPEDPEYEPVVRAPRQLVDAADPSAAMQTPQELMDARTPMNLEAIDAPVPKSSDVRTVVANPRPPPPAAHQIASALSPKAQARAEQYMALETAAAQNGLNLSDDAPLVSSLQADNVILERRQNVDKEPPMMGGSPVVRRNSLFVDGTKGPGGLHPRRGR